MNPGAMPEVLSRLWDKLLSSPGAETVDLVLRPHSDAEYEGLLEGLEGFSRLLRVRFLVRRGRRDAPIERSIGGWSDPVEPCDALPPTDSGSASGAPDDAPQNSREDLADVPEGFAPAPRGGRPPTAVGRAKDWLLARCSGPPVAPTRGLLAECQGEAQVSEDTARRAIARLCEEGALIREAGAPGGPDVLRRADSPRDGG